MIIGLPVPSWPTKAPARLAQRARLRGDAGPAPKFQAFGLSQWTTARGEVMREPSGAGREGSWIHAQPRFVPRSVRRIRAGLGRDRVL